MNVLANIIRQILLFITSVFKTADADSEGIDQIDNFDANIIEENRLTLEGILRVIDPDCDAVAQANDLFYQMFCYEPAGLLEGRDFNAWMVRKTSRDIVQATRILTVLRQYLTGRVS